MGLFDTIKKSAEILMNEILQDGTQDGTNERPQKTETEKRELKKESFEVVGIFYYEENLNKLRVANPDYKKKTFDTIKRVYKYNYINKPVKLIPEPKNKHDKNAIQVVIAGELVGYISMEDNLHVKKILTKHEVKYISSFISGGEYKTVSPNGTVQKDEKKIHIDISIGYV